MQAEAQALIPSGVLAGLLAPALVSAGSCAALCAALCRHGWLAGLGARPYAADMPQRFHAGHVPRLGGLGMLLAACAGWAWLLQGQAWVWWAVAAVAVSGGLLEDVTLRLQARWRLAATVVAGVVAWWLLDLRITRLGVPVLDAVLVAVPGAPALLAVLAVAGLPHAFNLIDGYNGLAGAVALACCLVLAHVAVQVGDLPLAGVVLVLGGATAGFLVWNYPRGWLFAGDGGAYLWGGVIAVVVILLVQRHPQVSPWFAMLLLAYPVGETFFSAYRKLARGQSPGQADALHLHQLIHRRIVQRMDVVNEAGDVVGDEAMQARRILARNNRTTPYLWVLALATLVPAALWWSRTGVLQLACALFAVAYVVAYLGIVRFKVPRWLRRGRRGQRGPRAPSGANPSA